MIYPLEEPKNAVSSWVMGFKRKFLHIIGIIDHRYNIPEKVLSNFSEFHILVVFTYNISLLDGAENANRTPCQSP